MRKFSFNKEVDFSVEIKEGERSNRSTEAGGSFFANFDARTQEISQNLALLTELVWDEFYSCEPEN